MIAASGEGRSGVWGSARQKFAFTLPRPTRAFAVSLLRHSILGWGMGSLNDSLRQCILRWPGILHRSPIIADGLHSLSTLPHPGSLPTSPDWLYLLLTCPISADGLHSLAVIPGSTAPVKRPSPGVGKNGASSGCTGVWIEAPAQKVGPFR